MRTHTVYQREYVDQRRLDGFGKRRHLELMTTGNSSSSLFGQVLRAMRDKQKLTQDEAAERAGISANYWGKLERGDADAARLPLDTLRGMADAVGATPDARYLLICNANGRAYATYKWAIDTAKLAEWTKDDLPPLEDLIEAHPQITRSRDKAALLTVLDVLMSRVAPPEPLPEVADEAAEDTA